MRGHLLVYLQTRKSSAYYFFLPWESLRKVYKQPLRSQSVQRVRSGHRSCGSQLEDASTAMFRKAWLPVALVYGCPALKHTQSICGRGEVPLQRGHRPDGGVPLTEGKGMPHLPVTETAWVVFAHRKLL